MTAAMRLGLVGAGGIAQAYLTGLEGCGFARLTAIADTRPEAARAAAELVGCPAFDSHTALAESGACEAVIVATPPNTHAGIVADLLDRGLPVLCEKPLTTDVPSMYALKAAAERSGVMLTMASKFRFVEDMIRAKSLAASGVIGEVVQLDNAFTGRVDMAKRWNSDPAVSGGGVIIDNGTHSVDIVRYLLGPITEVQAVTLPRVQVLPVEDSAALMAQTAAGAVAHIDLTWSLDKQLDCYVTLYGTQGLIRIGWRESKYRRNGAADWVVFGKGYDKVAALRRQVENFCKAVRGTELPLITLEDAVASVEVIEAAYVSLAQSHWAPVVAPRGNGRSHPVSGR